MNARLALFLLVACGSSPPPAAPPPPTATLDAATPDASPAATSSRPDAAIALAPDAMPVAPARPVPGHGPANVVPPDVRPAADCAGVRRITRKMLERLRDGKEVPGLRSGQELAVVGNPKPQIVCTAAVCAEACCNMCGGAYTIDVDYEYSVTLMGLPGCSGMDCNYRCEPFGIKPKRRYQFVGTLNSYYELTVTKYCKL